MKNLIKKIVESKFNFNIDIEDNERQNSLSKQIYTSKSQRQGYEEYLSKNIFVDLGLPSGTKWCKYNLGCDYELLINTPENTKVEDWYGDYYAWGEIETKTYYGWKDPNNPKQNYKWGDYNKLTKYCTDYHGYNIKCADYKRQLLPEDDVAYQNLHISRIPTKEQFKELIKYTTHNPIHSTKPYNFYEINDQKISNLYGIELTSKINKQKLFFPYAGFYGVSGLNLEFNLYNSGNAGGYWTANLSNDPSQAYYLNCNASNIISNIDIQECPRAIGLPIRPVINLK